MRRTIVTLLGAALLSTAPALTQDLGFTAVPGGPGGPVLIGITNQGAVAGLTSKGLLGSSTPTGLNGFSPRDVAVGDFNADGIADIAVALPGTTGGTLTLFSGEGQGTFGLPLQVPLSGTPTSMAVADIDLDGFEDVVVGGAAGSGGQIEVFSGNFLSNGIPNPIMPQSVDATPVSVAVGRLNNDAFGDIAVAFGSEGGGVEVIFGAAPSPEGDIVFAGHPFSVDTGTGPEIHFSFVEIPHLSLTAVKDLDLAFVTTSGVSMLDVSDGPTGPVFRIEEELSFAGGSNVPAGNGPVGLVLDDFNRDNLVDVATLNAGSGTVSTFLASAGGGFSSPTSVPAGTNPVSLNIVNFNNDGIPDIAVANASGASGAAGTVQVLTGNGSGAFTTGPNLPMTSFPNLLASGFVAPPGSPGTFNVMVFCRNNPAACGGNGLTIGRNQNGVSAGTSSPAKGDPRGGNEGHEARRFDVIRHLGRYLAGLLSFGRPAHLANARYPSFDGSQMRGQVQPAQVIFTATGQSTGDFFRMEIVDRSGLVHRGTLPEGIVLEPIASPPAIAPPDAGVTTQAVSGFCLDFTKDVPPAGTRYRIASPAAQAQAAPMRNVLAAAKQLALRNLLHSDGSPGYVNFIRQYAVWAKRENWDLKKFGESFVERTKQNVLSMKASWTDVMEQGVRAAIPGRWRDIEEVLRLSNQIATAPAR